MSNRFVGITTFLIVATAGCGGGTADSNTTSTPTTSTTSAPGSAGGDKSACTLLTKAEVEAALGMTTDSGSLSKSGAAQICTFSGIEKALASVIVQTYRGDSVDAAKTAYGFMASSDFQPVTGIGDEARYGTRMGRSGTIAVRRGKLAIAVSLGGVAGAQEPPTEAQLKDLVTKALQRS